MRSAGRVCVFTKIVMCKQEMSVEDAAGRNFTETDQKPHRSAELWLLFQEPNHCSHSLTRHTSTSDQPELPLSLSGQKTHWGPADR